MIWDEVMARVRVKITTDPVLFAIFGDSYRKAAPANDLIVPVIEWNLLGNTETELWEPMLLQFDLWTNDAALNRRAERRLRSMFSSHTNQIDLDGFTMLTEYSDGADLAAPTRSGYVGRGVRFRFIPLRQQYARAL